MTGGSSGEGFILGGLLCAAIALYSLSIVIWPRWFIWLDTVLRFQEQPEPKAWYLDWTRLMGAIPFVIFTIASILLFTAPGREAAVDAERLDMAEHAAAVCSELTPLLTAAVEIGPAGGSIANTEHLESIITDHGAKVSWELSPGGARDLRWTVGGNVWDPESTLTLLTITPPSEAGSDEGVLSGDCSVDEYLERLDRLNR